MSSGRKRRGSGGKKLVSTPRETLKEPVAGLARVNLRQKVVYVDEEEPDVIVDHGNAAKYHANGGGGGDDMADEDQEAFDMIRGKYGKATRLLSKRSQNGSTAAGGELDLSDQIFRQQYGFRTPNKKNGMMERTAAALMASPASSTPSSSSGGRMSATPAKGSAALASSSATMTPTARRALHNSMQAASGGGVADTPRSRRRLETPIKKMALKAGESDLNTPCSTRLKVAKSLATKGRRQGYESDEEDSSSSSGSEGHTSSEEKDTDSEADEAHKAAASAETPKRKIRGAFVSSKSVASPSTAAAANVTPPTTSSSAKQQQPVVPAAKRRAGAAAAKWAKKENTDGYFEAHGSSRIVTSDKTIDRSVKLSRLSPEELRDLLSKEQLPFAKEIRELDRSSRSHFRDWFFWLRNDFSILAYGMGSKKSLLTDFRSFVNRLEPESHFVVVNGFFPALNVKQILNTIAEMLEMEAVPAGLTDHCDAICQRLSDPSKPPATVYLVIHNLEGLALRQDKAQGAIAQLASSPRLRLIASIDHINAPLLWDASMTSKFNFVWFDATNFRPYTEETLNENSIFARQGACGNQQQAALNSLARVFDSLTPNARGIYVAIAKYQMNAVKELEESAEAAGGEGGGGGAAAAAAAFYQGISFKDLYQKCRKSFLVNSDLTLRAQLTEFRDHKLIKERKGSDDGIDYLVIPLKNNTLAEFLQQHDVN